MFTSFSEFKFYQSFRLPVEKADELRFLIEKTNSLGKEEYIEDGKLLDISVTGFGFSTLQRISVGTSVQVSLQFKRYHLDLTGKVVRSFSDTLEDDSLIYGVELDEEKGLHKFLENYVLSFSSERLKDCLTESALKERYNKASDGFEMFSLLLSLFKDINHFKDKDGFIDNMMQEVVRILNAQRSSIFLINADTNELEAISALGLDKTSLKFDYRLGIAGSVFTTGVALNIDTVKDKTRFNQKFDKKFNFETKSVICHPIHNREDKIVGVIEVINKRNEDRFTVEDEKTMKVLALVFSSVFHNYNPISEISQIRRFSTPFDRKFALVGKTQHLRGLRSSILKLKDLDESILILGERGTGKSLYASIIHYEGGRGLNAFERVNCEDKDIKSLEIELFGGDESKLVKCRGGVVFLHQVGKLSSEHQKKLYKVLIERAVPGSKFSIDIRIVASSSDNLMKMVENGEFNRELYECISKGVISIDPLRRRSEDIECLVDYFLKLECKEQGLLLKSFSPKLLDRMLEYDWPGNISELKLCVDRAVLYNPKTHIITDVDLKNRELPMVDFEIKQRSFGELPHVTDSKVVLKDRLAIVEREMIFDEVRQCDGNKTKAAKQMGISREALRKKVLISDEVVERLDENKHGASISKMKRVKEAA